MLISRSQFNRHAALILLAFSVALVAANEYLPPKRIQLFPHPQTAQQLYGYSAPRTGQSSKWIDEEQHQWKCDYQPDHMYGCGSSVSWSKSVDKGTDLSQYDTLVIQLEYEGTSKRLRVSMRNFNEAYSIPERPQTSKHLNALVRTEDIRNNQLEVDLASFNVSIWWIQEFNIPHRWVFRELNNVTSVGLEIAEPSVNKVKITSISAKGKWVNSQALLYSLVVAWLAFILIQGAFQFYLVYKSSQKGRSEIRDLIRRQDDLETEKQYLENIAKMDPLTGIYNRNGFFSAIEKIAPGNISSVNNLAILILDLDKFKQINDQFGHDFGDEVLKKFSQFVQNNIRENDIVTRWGGEEFVILCEAGSQKTLRSFAEKLRRCTEKIRFSSHSDFSFSVSIGATYFNVGEHFDDALRRADIALYQAKNQGRNRVVYEL